MLIRIPEGPAVAIEPDSSGEGEPHAIVLPGMGKVIVRHPPPYRGSQPPPRGKHFEQTRQEIEKNLTKPTLSI